MILAPWSTLSAPGILASCKAAIEICSILDENLTGPGGFSLDGNKLNEPDFFLGMFKYETHWGQPEGGQETKRHREKDASQS